MSDKSTLHTLTGEDAISFVHEAVWGFAEVDPDYKFTWVNPAYCKILGAPYQLILGTTFMEWTHEEDLGIDKDLADQVKEGKIPGYTLRKRYIQHGSTPQRRIIIWGFLSVAGAWKDGKFVGFRVQFRPFNNIDKKKPSLHIRETLGWLKINWKIISTVILMLTSLIYGGYEQLLTTWKEIQATETSAKSTQQQSPSGP